MKRLMIAAALALAVPAFAAEEAAKAPAQPQPAQKAAPAPQAPEKEQVAIEGISKDVTLEAAPSAKDAGKQSLRFERWAREAEDEPFESDAEWNAHRK